MTNKLSKKYITLFLTLVMLILQSTTVYGAPVNVKYNIVKNQENINYDNYNIITFTNKQVFDALEAGGIDIHSILTEEEIRAALRKDMLRSGENKIVVIDNDTVDVYISTEALKAMGAAGMAGSVLLGFIPLAGPYLAAISGFLVGVAIDYNTPVILRLKTKIIEKGDEWGVTYYVYSTRPQ